MSLIFNDFDVHTLTIADNNNESFSIKDITSELTTTGYSLTVIFKKFNLTREARFYLGGMGMKFDTSILNFTIRGGDSLSLKLDSIFEKDPIDVTVHF